MARGISRGKGARGGNRGRGTGVSRLSSTQNEGPSSQPSSTENVGSTPQPSSTENVGSTPQAIIPMTTDGTSNLAHGEPSTSHEIPSTPHESPSPSTRASTTQSEGARPFVFIKNGRLFPESTSAQITKIILKRLYPTGYNWKSIPDNEKNEYFKDFANTYIWAEEDEIPIRNLFMKQAANRYRDTVSSWKAEWFKSKKKPGCISEEHWQSWITYWNKPETIARSKKNSANRMSEVEPGKGPSKHTGGSKSAVGHMLAMQKERGGVMPTLFDIQKRTHMRKDGTFVDERSKKICEEVERRIAVASTEEDSASVDTNKIYLEVVGGVKKQRVYGIGSLSAVFVDSQTRASQGSSVDVITQRLESERVEYTQRHEELKKELEEERAIREKLAEELEQEKSNRAKLTEQLETQNSRLETQASQLKLLMDSLAKQGFSL